MSAIPKEISYPYIDVNPESEMSKFLNRIDLSFIFPSIFYIAVFPFQSLILP